MQVELNSAESLIDILSKKKCKLLFRGERTSRKFIPSAFRNAGQDYYHGELRKETILEYVQIANEYDVIHRLASVRLPILKRMDSPFSHYIDSSFEEEAREKMKMLVEETLPTWFPSFKGSIDHVSLAQHFT